MKDEFVRTCQRKEETGEQRDRGLKTQFPKGLPPSGAAGIQKHTELRES